jgi:preprotein translocase subunit SecG
VYLGEELGRRKVTLAVDARGAALAILGLCMIYAVGAITALHVVICLFLIVVVLLQSGKAADLAGAFGGMGSQTVFGPRGANTILSKATTIAAALFMVTALTLTIMSQRQGAGAGSSVLDKYQRKIPAQGPVVPLSKPPAHAPAGQAPTTPAAAAPQGQAPATPKK